MSLDIIIELSFRYCKILKNHMTMAHDMYLYIHTYINGLCICNILLSCIYSENSHLLTSFPPPGAADVSLGFWLAPLEGIRFVSPLVDFSYSAGPLFFCVSDSTMELPIFGP